MIVVVSHPNDLHASEVCSVLSASGHENYVFDVADLPKRASLTIDYVEPSRPVARLHHETAGWVNLTEASAVWWRRPRWMALDGITDAAARGFAYGEWHAALTGMYRILRCSWMNEPGRDEAASSKLLQLAVAARIGLAVPATLVTSDANEARTFIERLGVNRTVYKIFSATEEIWRETRLVRNEDLPMLGSLNLAPVIFQEYIVGVADIRVTVVGDEVFAMSIDTRGTGYEVDFRINLAQAQTNTHELPDPIMQAIRELVDTFGLVYGAIDMKLTADGSYVFLEINPAGEFLFVERACGLPITAAVAGWLAAPDERP